MGTNAKAKRGRPPLPEGAARKVSTGVALTEAERKALRKLAEKSGTSIGEYIRARLRLS